MIKRHLFTTVTLFAVFFMSCENRNEAKTERPNIILIMADDQGWGDTGYNGHPYLETPALDDMASNGAVFNRFYAASAVCSPTRGSVITGRHPERYGICSANCGHIKNEEITLAELVKEKGYVTGHFGKWHLGTLTCDTLDANRGGKPENDVHYAPPWEHGFDVCFVTESKVPTWNPMVVPPKSAGDIKPDLTEGEFFGTFYWKGPGQIETSNLEGDDSRIIMDRVIPFIDKAVDKNQPFLTVVWFHSPHLPVLTGEKYRRNYDDLSEDQQHFYGTIQALDEQVGRLREHLRKLNIEKQTIAFYTSDNGPEGRDVINRTQGLTKGLKGRKRSLYEGGIRVPGLMEWPGTIEPASIDVPCFTSDYFPTIASILGIDIKKYHRPYDGTDLFPMLLKKNSVPERGLGFRFKKQDAFIEGDFKIYREDQESDFEIYNLKTDPDETTNLAEDHQELLNSMIEKWSVWQQSVNYSALGMDYN